MNKKNLLLLALIFLASFIIYTLTARKLGFQVVLNDFWTVFYYGRNLNLATPATLANSLFPIGYAAILGLMPVRHALWMAFTLNIGLASAAVTTTSALALTGNNRPRAALVALVGIFYPLTFRYANTIGPDLGVATFIALGLFFLWKNDLDATHPQRFFPFSADLLAGACLGLASLWRSHAIVAGVAILVVYAGVMGIKAFWQRRFILVAFLLVAGIQALINLIAGHGAIENAQYFNIYKTFFGNDWLTVPQAADDHLLMNLILTQPLAIFKEYAPQVWKVAVYGWAAVPLFFVSQSKTIRRFAVFCGVTIFLYALPVAFGSSPRAPIAMTPLAFAAFGFLASETHQRLPPRPWARILALIAFTAAGAWFAYQWTQTNTQFIQAFSDQHERYLNIERRLRSKGLTSPDEVFTNRYNFYLPTTPPYQPRSNGGWDVTTLWNYRARYPELPVGSWDEFSAACKTEGIRFLVLNPYSYELAPFFGDLYQKKFVPDNIEILKFVGDYQVIMFK